MTITKEQIIIIALGVAAIIVFKKTMSNDVTMPLDEVIDEHRRLVNALKTGDKTKLKKELEYQQAELADYEKKKG